MTENNLPAIRKFVTKHFNDQELRDITFDDFRDVYNEFTAEMSKSKMAELLVSYCYRHERIPDLIAVLQRERPFAKEIPDFKSTGTIKRIRPDQNGTEGQFAQSSKTASQARNKLTKTNKKETGLLKLPDNFKLTIIVAVLSVITIAIFFVWLFGSEQSREWSDPWFDSVIWPQLAQTAEWTDLKQEHKNNYILTVANAYSIAPENTRFVTNAFSGWPDVKNEICKLSMSTLDPVQRERLNAIALLAGQGQSCSYSEINQLSETEPGTQIPKNLLPEYRNIYLQTIADAYAYQFENTTIVNNAFQDWPDAHIDICSLKSTIQDQAQQLRLEAIAYIVSDGQVCDSIGN